MLISPEEAELFFALYPSVIGFAAGRSRVSGTPGLSSLLLMKPRRRLVTIFLTTLNSSRITRRRTLTGFVNENWDICRIGLFLFKMIFLLSKI